MKRINEIVKEDIGLTPQSLASTNNTGKYFLMQNYRQCLLHLVTGTIVAGGTVTVSFLQATDAAGSNAKAITNATATVTSGTKDISADVALASVSTGDTVTINGVTFTQGSTVVASRTFADAAGLVLCIASSTYGVPGVTGTVANTNHVVLTSTVPGETAITVSRANVGGTITLSTVEAQAYVEVEVSQLDTQNATYGPFIYLAAHVVTGSATVLCAVSLQRGQARYLPVQIVGASAAV